MIIEGIVTLILVSALLYVSPSVLALTRQAAPAVYASTGPLTAGNGTVDAGLNATVGSVSTSVAGGLSLTAISPIMIGIGLMIGAFMLVRARQ